MTTGMEWGSFLRLTFRCLVGQTFYGGPLRPLPPRGFWISPGKVACISQKFVACTRRFSSTFLGCSCLSFVSFFSLRLYTYLDVAIKLQKVPNQE
jgi:hypothetical protein